MSAPANEDPALGWMRDCAALAAASGILHDIGKFGEAFQTKLTLLTPTADPVRHEWISLCVARHMLTGKNWDDAWAAQTRLPPTKRWTDVTPFGSQLQDAKAVLLYLIATHHKLPSMMRNVISHGKHVRDIAHEARPVAAPSAENMAAIEKAIHEVCSMPPRSAFYWRAAATLARMALILADHGVSKQKVFSKGATAYANTDRKTGMLNQSLDWHLKHVSKAAPEVFVNMMQLAPPVLSKEIVDGICATVPATSTFYWQQKAFDALATSRQQNDQPYLVLNMAGTGSGKTRMNVRAVCAVGDRYGEGIRFATALNLRTLTLQTGDAYAEQLNIPKNELSCIIGDELTSTLHEYQKSLRQSLRSYPEQEDELIADDDENSPETEFDAVTGFAYQNAPDWLAHFLETKPKLASVIGAPVLVSTIDFLIAAGEPHRQGNHALAALRLMTSDLILDEIDGYDPKAFLAVLRLVMMSAMFGRSVIASSATLSKEVAKLLWLAYEHGTKMRGELVSKAVRFNTAFIDNMSEPVVAQYDSVDDYLRAYHAHVRDMLKHLVGQQFRVPYLQTIEKKSDASWFAAICSAVERFHAAHRHQLPNGGLISFGLVRIANIRTAVKVASYLARALPCARIVCYHAQHLPMQRFHIEQRLDALLRRTRGNSHFAEDQEILEAAEANRQNGQENTIFIVVATPVEEIGRDHDFDWGVIEPSGTQSIVQTAGRINRHRMQRVSSANIALLQFNYRAIRGDKEVFSKPGLEFGESHPDHDLMTLLDWGGGIDQVDARLRFDTRHRFNVFDDAALADQAGLHFNRLISTGRYGPQWMGNETYSEAPLRDRAGVRIEMHLTDTNFPGRFLVKEELSDEPAQFRDLLFDEAIPNVWLVKGDAELETMAAEAGASREQAFTVSATGPFSKDGRGLMRRHLSFGFYRA